jgi:hypothetical protein
VSSDSDKENSQKVIELSKKFEEQREAYEKVVLEKKKLQDQVNELNENKLTEEKV